MKYLTLIAAFVAFAFLPSCSTVSGTVKGGINGLKKDLRCLTGSEACEKVVVDSPVLVPVK